jgi:hypothetical protein
MRAAWKSKPPSKADVDAVKLKQEVNEKLSASAQKLRCALRASLVDSVLAEVADGGLQFGFSLARALSRRP